VFTKDSLISDFVLCHFFNEVIQFFNFNFHFILNQKINSIS